MEPARQAIRVAFDVHSFDADAFGLLAPAALAGYLQEAAGRSADRLGFGLADLNRRGATWVLARERLELSRPVRLGERLEVETWPSGLDRLAALRDFVLRCDGEEVGRAVTTWFVLDLATRRPLRPDRILPEPLHGQLAHVLPPARAAVPELPAAAELERLCRDPAPGEVLDYLVENIPGGMTELYRILGRLTPRPAAQLLLDVLDMRLKADPRNPCPREDHTG